MVNTLFHFQCLAAELSLEDTTISDIASEINNAIQNVANVDGILANTGPALIRVQELAISSKQAESYAKSELAKANKVTDDLSKASVAQNKADLSIQATQTKIGSAREDLAQVNIVTRIFFGYITLFKIIGTSCMNY